MGLVGREVGLELTEVGFEVILEWNGGSWD